MLHIIGIDIETTGLDPAKGEIIEVAALRYALNGHSGKSFVRLCKPSQPISDEITALTGITNEMMNNAHCFEHILPNLREFIGDSLIFAHNASFDIKWLSYNGLSIDNSRVLDTFNIAAVAWPEAESYNLKTLCQILGIHNQSVDGRGEHSAKYDVDMAWQVLQAARRELVATPRTHKKIIDALDRSGLGHYIPLFSASNKGNKTKHKFSRSSEQIFPSLSSSVDVLGVNGPLAKYWHDFTPRPEQQRMAEIVEKNLNEEGVNLIEAPTGTGKTMAYLTPLLLGKMKGKTAISTYTKHLQDQLVTQDLPRLQKVLNTKRTTAILKGRRNYVCSRRLGLALERLNLSKAEVWLLLKVLLWLDKGGSGDMDRLNISHQGVDIVSALQADSPVCRKGCPNTLCPYQGALKAAGAADILIVNHALLADPLFFSRWSLAVLIVDEAHHLEKAIRRASRVSLSSHDLKEIFGPLLQLEGGEAMDRHLRLEATHAIKQYQAVLTAMAQFMRNHTRHFILRLTTGMRQSSEWSRIEKHSSQCLTKLSFIIGLLEALSGHPLMIQLDDLIEDLRNMAANINRFVEGDSSRVQWLEIYQANQPMRPGADPISIYDVALSIEPSLKRLYENIPSIIFTSATLTAEGNFSFIRQSLGITEASSISLTSSFNLAENLQIYLIEDAPAPNVPVYGAYLAQLISNVARLLGGRTLGLFTSFNSLNSVYKLLLMPLNKGHIRLYAQGLTGGRSNMLNRFRDGPGSVLMGCESFWEGIDVPGDMLSCVVITKLPFPLPNDPMISAIAESARISMFNDLALPHMILKLRQGIGRLLRTKTDRGVVVICDSRLNDARYREAVLKSLPAGRIESGLTMDLIPAIKKWMGEDLIELWKKEVGN